MFPVPLASFQIPTSDKNNAILLEGMEKSRGCAPRASFILGTQTKGRVRWENPAKGGGDCVVTGTMGTWKGLVPAPGGFQEEEEEVISKAES